jgi:hypothetical protein
MNAPNADQELYFDICREHISKHFGDLVLSRDHGQSFMTIHKVAPHDGGKAPRFYEDAKMWEDTDLDYTSWSVVQDGKVFVCYPDDVDSETGLVFNVGHPREVSELLRLFVQPASSVSSGEKCQYETRLLGDVVEIYVLIPDGDAWRVLDPDTPPPGAPDDFLRVVHLNLIQNWDKLCSGDPFEAFKIAQRWPEYVKSLPTASGYLRGGYILTPDSVMQSAAAFSVTAPSGRALFLNLLVVPAETAVSAMYLREFLNSDITAGKDVQKAFAADTDLHAFAGALKKTRLRVDANIHH